MFGSRKQMKTKVTNPRTVTLHFCNNCCSDGSVKLKEIDANKFLPNHNAMKIIHISLKTGFF